MKAIDILHRFDVIDITHINIKFIYYIQLILLHIILPD